MNKQGFSLVETMVTVFIFVILAGGLYATLQVGDSSWQTNQTKVELQQELRKAIDWMKDEFEVIEMPSIIAANEGE